MLDVVRQIKPSTAAHIKNIENSGTLWKSSQWIDWQHPYLPPQYRIATSNTTSESVNNILTGARDSAWMDVLEKC